MKKILFLFLFFYSLFIYSQNKYYILFNSNKDKIVYRQFKKKKEIDGFRIFIDNKYIYFFQSDIKANYKSNKIINEKKISRNELIDILKKDKQEKSTKYVIVLNNNYYFVDHILRTIKD